MQVGKGDSGEQEMLKSAPEGHGASKPSAADACAIT